ncbi:MAG TPA: histidine phosphatase family protein [Rectinemataceae bacterium]|nr:histidine phosphatase family protein [Rectinemataceae bacterium]
MKVYFLRHGDAGDRHHWEGDDSLRPLTKQGEGQITALASAVRGLVPPSPILTSPYLRAHRTAALFATGIATGIGAATEPLVDKRLAPGFGREYLGEILQEYRNEDAILLVGHEPDFSRLIARLIQGGSLVLKKGGLARVDWNPVSGEGELEWLFPPAIFRPESDSPV